MIDIGPLESTFMAALVGVPILLLTGFLVNDLPRLWGAGWTSVVYSIAAGLLNFVLGRFFWYLGIRLVGASRSNSIVATEVLFAPLMAMLLLGETASIILAPAVLLIFLGSFIISKSYGSGLGPSHRDVILGILVSFGASIVFSVGALAAKVAVGLFVSSFIAYLVGTLASSVCLFPAVYIRKKGIFNSNSKSKKILLVASLTQVFASISYWGALKLAPVVLVIPLTQTYPLFTLILSYLFIRRLEQLNLLVVAGSLLMVIGTVLVVWA